MFTLELARTRWRMIIKLTLKWKIKKFSDSKQKRMQANEKKVFLAGLHCHPLFWVSDSLGVWVGVFLIEKQDFGTGYLTKNASPSQLVMCTRSIEHKFVAEAEDCMVETGNIAGQDCHNSESEKCVKVNQTLRCCSRKQALQERCYSLEKKPQEF